MKVDEMLRMNGGTGETSYATNSFLQQKVMSMTRPIVEQAITGLACSSSFPKETLVIADLGCALGSNAFFAVSEIVKAVVRISRKLGRESPKEFQIFLNDLPVNDFNSIFTSVQEFKQKMKKEIGGAINDQLLMFFNGIPGSFYGRLFPAESLHFVHSSYSLHWLSQVPRGLEENGRNILVASSSPPSVFNAYCRQFRNDFSSFLRCRAVEMLTGGRMVLTLQGRRSEDGWGGEFYTIWELLLRSGWWLRNLVTMSI